MRSLLVGLLLVCASLCGCSQMEEVQRTGRSVNALPTDRELKAGY